MQREVVRLVLARERELPNRWSGCLARMLSPPSRRSRLIAL